MILVPTPHPHIPTSSADLAGSQVQQASGKGGVARVTQAASVRPQLQPGRGKGALAGWPRGENENKNEVCHVVRMRKHENE